MRLISWNIRGGRHSDVVAAIQRLGADVAVLVDCKEKRVETIVTKAAEAGFTHHLASCTDYTGILILSTHPMFKGDIVQVDMPHRWLHAVSDHWDLEIAAMYGPLPKAIRQERTMKEFWNWLVPATDRLVLRRAVLCGDFNTGTLVRTGRRTIASAVRISSRISKPRVGGTPTASFTPRDSNAVGGAMDAASGSTTACLVEGCRLLLASTTRLRPVAWCSGPQRPTSPLPFLTMRRWSWTFRARIQGVSIPLRQPFLEATQGLV